MPQSNPHPHVPPESQPCPRFKPQSNAHRHTNDVGTARSRSHCRAPRPAIASYIGRTKPHHPHP